MDGERQVRTHPRNCDAKARKRNYRCEPRNGQKRLRMALFLYRPYTSLCRGRTNRAQIASRSLALRFSNQPVPLAQIEKTPLSSQRAVSKTCPHKLLRRLGQRASCPLARKKVLLPRNGRDARCPSGRPSRRRRLSCPERESFAKPFRVRRAVSVISVVDISAKRGKNTSKMNFPLRLGTTDSAESITFVFRQTHVPGTFVFRLHCILITFDFRPFPWTSQTIFDIIHAEIPEDRLCISHETSMPPC